MVEEKILTEHPSGKIGKNIDKIKYDAIKQAIIEVLHVQALTHTDLINLIYEKLKDTFNGNVHWYGETVKLDLEARGIIARTNDKPQKYFLK